MPLSIPRLLPIAPQLIPASSRKEITFIRSPRVASLCRVPGGASPRVPFCFIFTVGRSVRRGVICCVVVALKWPRAVHGPLHSKFTIASLLSNQFCIAGLFSNRFYMASPDLTSSGCVPTYPCTRVLICHTLEMVEFDRAKVSREVR